MLKLSKEHRYIDNNKMTTSKLNKENPSASMKASYIFLLGPINLMTPLEVITLCIFRGDLDVSCSLDVFRLLLHLYLNVYI
jgi:hypothetical protein